MNFWVTAFVRARYGSLLRTACLLCGDQGKAEGRTRDEYVMVDQRDWLRRALDGLSARQRSAVVLRYYEDLSEQDTAKVLDCSVGTVKSLSSRACRPCAHGGSTPTRRLNTRCDVPSPTELHDGLAELVEHVNPSGGYEDRILRRARRLRARRRVTGAAAAAVCLAILVTTFRVVAVGPAPQAEGSTAGVLHRRRDRRRRLAAARRSTGARPGHDPGGQSGQLSVERTGRRGG
ncbi:sigma factor-like helix-turn-helix DNA-binding protein [Actinoplanes sp. NPDC051494]|uniref:sigma factor-like helix-turn-helix DNA-binding protein n=1 Tax=Actinoplanes sp. NPDC051494 TaxID=3363907 RepID=UPI00379DEC96